MPWCGEARGDVDTPAGVPGCRPGLPRTMGATDPDTILPAVAPPLLRLGLDWTLFVGLALTWHWRMRRLTVMKLFEIVCG